MGFSKSPFLKEGEQLNKGNIGANNKRKNKKIYQKKWFWFLMVLLLILFGAGFFLYKVGWTISEVTGGKGLVEFVSPIMGDSEIEQDERGTTNILLLGMRGKNVPGGGLLADTIMVVSIKPDENKAAMISIPRDLYVKVPNADWKSKINGVFANGEKDDKNQGFSDMRSIVGEITGLPIHYAMSINFEGFKELVDSIGGVEITLEESFSEPLQFREEHVCDPNVFTVPTGNYEKKIDHRGKVVAQYPLCVNKNLECGGVFNLPAGLQTLDGETALCFVRSRKTSNDFERAKRQQLLLKALKDKLTSVGTLTNFSKVSSILDAVGGNVRIDGMDSGEMKKLYERYSELQNTEIKQIVFEATEDGLLQFPSDAPPEAGSILIPSAGWDNYSEMQQACQGVFVNPDQDLGQEPEQASESNQGSQDQEQGSEDE